MTGVLLVEVGGLARTDQAGYGEEFTRLARAVLIGGEDLMPVNETLATYSDWLYRSARS